MTCHYTGGGYPVPNPETDPRMRRCKHCGTRLYPEQLCTCTAAWLETFPAAREYTKRTKRNLTAESERMLITLTVLCSVCQDPRRVLVGRRLLRDVFGAASPAEANLVKAYAREQYCVFGAFPARLLDDPRKWYAAGKALVPALRGA